ncbi:MAG: exodeoxyribonuclease VII large subunit [Gammaproteobacteria bacterium]
MDTETADIEPSIKREIYSISRLNHEARTLLEREFPLIWVEGEISNLARPSSGHIYLSLKDDAAQVRCAMFRNRNQLLGFNPNNGLQVLVRARISLYEARGDYQLIIEHMEEAGDGALRREFEQLKNRLQDEGLFESTLKRPLPTLPKQIGVVTSPTGAAIRDIITVLERRFPAIPVLIYPTAVQGKSAAPQIAATIDLASARDECDVLIVGRGGGSLEDLWAFNEEVVARSIYACKIPIITGIGHEVDFTIADFVADLRAPTPTGAAEISSPDQEEFSQSIKHDKNKLTLIIQKTLKFHSKHVEWLSKRLRQTHPGQRLQQQSQRVDELEKRLHRSVRSKTEYHRTLLKHASARFQQNSPLHRIEQAGTHYHHTAKRLMLSMDQRLKTDSQRLLAIVNALDAMSPLATLARGYAIVKRQPQGDIVKCSKDINIGDFVEATLSQGSLTCQVTEKNDP